MNKSIIALIIEIQIIEIMCLLEDKIVNELTEDT